MKRLRDYLATNYLPKARDGFGLLYMKGGDELYRYLVQSTTTLPLTPEEIHQTGLSEVARITGEMEKVQAGGRLQGHAAAVLRPSAHRSQVQEADPRGADPGLLRHRQGGRRQAAGLFLDASQGEARDPPLRAVPREVRRPAAAMSRARPTARGPGIFYFNAYDLPSRTTPGMTTLYLHEGSPGHHFQISLAQENAALPPFMRFGGNTAYRRRLGALCRDARLRRWASTRTRSSGSARSTTRCCARCGWWSTPASIPRVGPASRRSTTCWRNCEHGQDRRHRRGRALHRHSQPGARLQDRRDDDPAAARARPRRSWATSSTSANSTPRC